jgi:hypothetical protein
MSFRLSSVVPFAPVARSVLMIASPALKPVPDKPVAARFPLWRSASRVIASAAATDGPMVRFGGFQTIPVLAAGGPE